MNNPKIWLSSPHMGGTEQKYIQEAFFNALKTSVKEKMLPLDPKVFFK